VSFLRDTRLMQFWCSATNTAWTWTWTAYPGVWLFIALFWFGVSRWNRAAARRAGAETGPMHPGFYGGLVLLWLALDWPIGALGAGYLASIHMVQFILIAMLAPPALLLGLSPSALASADRSAIVRRLTSPVMALVLFNAVVLLTHLPPIVDTLMQSQLGSMLIDLLWLASGLLFWWPIILATPARPRFVPPLRMLYLMVGLMFSPVMFGLAGFMVYAPHPLYGVYELAPPFAGFSSRDDHQLAGVLMSIGGAIVAFVGLTVTFFRWSKTDG
jgi:putative membrane protein